MPPRAVRSVLVGLLCAALAVHAAVLVDFQVAQPPPLPQDARQCTIQLFQYVDSLHVGRGTNVNIVAADIHLGTPLARKSGAQKSTLSQSESMLAGLKLCNTSECTLCASRGKT